MSTTQDIPYGCCHCGCGERTPLWAASNANRGRVKGEPAKFIRGHNNRRRERYVVEDRGYETPCWIWQLLRAKEGHGRMDHNGRLSMAHMVYFEEKYGPVPEGRLLHHRCEQPACVNPDHLEPLTPAQHNYAHSRLTPEDVREMRRMRAEGALVREVADLYGMSREHVGYILRGKCWAEV